MPDSDYRKRLEQQKQASTLQLLFKTGRLANERALAMVRARSPDTPVRPAHTALFPHIELEGTRQTVLASRLGISKQAVGQLVDDLVAMGMVERVPDPDDARARLVCFTAKGRLALLDGLAVLTQLQAELEGRLGAELMHALQQNLVALLSALEEGAAPG